MFKCCDCGLEIAEKDAGEKTAPNADGSATVQCVHCHVHAHETSNGAHEPLYSAFKRNRAACWACNV